MPRNPASGELAGFFMRRRLTRPRPCYHGDGPPSTCPPSAAFLLHPTMRPLAAQHVSAPLLFRRMRLISFHDFRQNLFLLVE